MSTPSRIEVWWLAIRPATLSAAVAPVLVGCALAAHDQHFAWLRGLAALLAALLIQIGANLVNDADDFQRGADTAARRGPLRVTQSGLLSAGEVRGGAYLAFALAAGIGVYLIAIGGWVVIVIGAASIAAAVAYTGGPWPLGYHGFGDVLVFLFFGLAAVVGTYYVQAGTISVASLIAASAIGMLATAILVVNNARDRETDVLAGKHTLAVRFGDGFARAEYTGLVLGAYVAPLWLWFGGVAGVLVLLPMVSLGRALALVKRVECAGDGPSFNRALGDTARLELVFSVLFAAGIVLAS